MSKQAEAVKTETETPVLSPSWNEALKPVDAAERAEQEKQEAAAAEAAFQALAGGEPPSVTEKQPVPEKTETATETETQTDTKTDDAGKTADEEPEPVNLSKEQFEELQSALEFIKQLQGGESELLSGLHQSVDQKLEQQNQKLTGKIGELNRVLQERGQPAKLTKDQFKRLSQVYEPELIDALVEDLSGIILQQPQQVNQDEILTTLQTKLNESFLESFKDKIVTPEQLQGVAVQMSDYTNEQILNFATPGWQKKIEDKRYDTFIDSLPAGVAKQIEASNDPSVLVQTIKDFDTWIAAQETQNQQRQTEKKEKQATLEKAQQPKGGGSPPTKTETNTEESAAKEEFERLQATRL